MHQMNIARCIWCRMSTLYTKHQTLRQQIWKGSRWIKNITPLGNVQQRIHWRRKNRDHDFETLPFQIIRSRNWNFMILGASEIWQSHRNRKWNFFKKSPNKLRGPEPVGGVLEFQPIFKKSQNFRVNSAKFHTFSLFAQKRTVFSTFCTFWSKIDQIGPKTLS